MHIELLVEESSAEAALNVLLPRILGPAHTFKVHPHQGKTDLLAVLPRRLHDCLKLKKRVEEMAASAGLITKSKPKGGCFVAITRIAVEELEAWFFGDRQAVVKAYPRLEGKKLRWPAKPDGIPGGTWESFECVLQKGGYHKSGYPKVHGARLIAEHMAPRNNTSPSFQCFRDGLRELLK